MRCYIQVLTTPTADTPGTTLLLHFDNKRYLIGNVSEGTQRAAVQQGARLLKVSGIFLTGRTEWDKNGGLIGMILTLADAASASSAAAKDELRKKIIIKARRQKKELAKEDINAQVEKEAKERVRLSIFGPSNLNYTLATARRFVFRKGMPLEVHELGMEGKERENGMEMPPTWMDDNIKVWAMPIQPAPGRKMELTSSGTVSPRKRGFDELNGKTPTATAEVVPAQDLTEKDKTVMTAKAVVSEMFDSAWRLDALFETPINQVKLPATLFVRNPDTNKIEKYEGPMPDGSREVPDINVLVRRPWPGALVETLPSTEPATEAVSYIFRNHYQRGKFRPERALELGVEKGIKWTRLSDGESVENAKGETITPDMVLEEGREGRGVAVVDLPSSDYVEAFINRPEWRSEEVMTGVGAFFWILGPGVLEHSLLKQFIQERKNMKHILSSPEACTNRLSMDSAAAATLRLKQVDPARYGVPVHDSNVTEAMTSNDFDLVADRGMELHLEPSIQLQQDKTSPILDMDQVLKKASPEVLELARQAQEDIKNDSALDVWANSLPSKDAEIVTLGTGSSIPSKYRNVSATLLRVPGWGSMLFDCGENTLGQLKRVFPADELQEILKELRIIWISHMHADHHLGTVSVIKAWYQAEHNMRPGLDPNPQSPSFRAHEHMKYGTRLSVIAEPAMLHWLYEYSHVEDYGFTRLAPLCISNASSSYNNTSSLNWFIPPSTEDYNPLTTHEAWLDKLTRSKVPASAINLADIQSVAVYHCHGARAVSLTFLSGFKVSYSGDCRPSKAFMQIGKGSTVCIHEATFDDELRGDAQAKSHSTTSEALGVAAGMNAKAALLTHFSQRYQKVPVMEYTDRDDNAAEAMIVDEAVSANPDDAPDDAMDGPISDLAATAASSAGPPATASDNYRPLLPAEASSAATTVKLMSGTDMKVCVAFDYMRVKVGEIAQLEKFTPALLKLFAAEEKDVEADAAAAGGGNAKNKEKKQKPGKSKRNN